MEDEEDEEKQGSNSEDGLRRFWYDGDHPEALRGQPVAASDVLKAVVMAVNVEVDVPFLYQ